MVLNSHDMLRFQLATATLVVIAVVPLKIVLLHAMGVLGCRMGHNYLIYTVFGLADVCILSQMVELIAFDMGTRSI